MQVYLAAVQARIEPEAYYSAATFKKRTVNLALAAVAAAPPDTPRVIAFPEAYALPLAFWLDTPESIRRAKNSLSAGLRLLGSLLTKNPASLLSRPLPDLLYYLRAPYVWPVYNEAFATAAREAGAYVIAGSLFAPPLDEEPARGVYPVARHSYNWLAVYSPHGTILARPAKVRLTAGEKSAFIRPAPFGSQVFTTGIGGMAVLICLDAFHESLVEMADASGAWLLVQPSANEASWNGPWTADPAEVEGEVWLREGLAKKLQGRENLRYGINPMLNGDFYEMHFEGRSSVAAAGEVLALASQHLGDETVSAVVELPNRHG